MHRREFLAAVDVRSGAAILDAPLSDPAFLRVESTLVRAIDAMPVLEPTAAASAAAPRIFELRTYESHSDRAALNKLQMFNAGEVSIFRRTGLTPVFFGETLVGARMPSLIYMLTFPNLTARTRRGVRSAGTPSGGRFPRTRSIVTTSRPSPTSSSGRRRTRRSE